MSNEEKRLLPPRVALHTPITVGGKKKKISDIKRGDLINEHSFYSLSYII